MQGTSVASRPRLNVRVARVACASMAAVGLAPLFVAFAFAQAGVQMRVVSNPRPDMVSGGDVLVQVDLPAAAATRDVRVTLNNADVTSAFRRRRAGRTLTGLVTGLAPGPNTLAARSQWLGGAHV